jgi:hypothetical protein
VTANQINEVVSNYFLHGDVNKFIVEFSPLSYNIHKTGEQDAITIAYKIESRLADLRAGFITKLAFSDFLSDLINPFVLNFSVPIAIFQPEDFIRLAAVPGTASSALAEFFDRALARESESERLVQH